MSNHAHWCEICGEDIRAYACKCGNSRGLDKARLMILKLTRERDTALARVRELEAELKECKRGSTLLVEAMRDNTAASDAYRTQISERNARIARLEGVIEAEAQYCYGYAEKYEQAGDLERAKRHRDRGDRLKASAEVK